MQFLSWLQDLEISQWVAGSDWGYPILLSIHSIGMGTVVGILAMFNLRVLGFRRDIPLLALGKFMKVALIGFFINATSGLLLFMSAATRLISNWPFLVKMFCIIIAGLLSWLLWRSLTHADPQRPRASAHVDANPHSDKVSRIIAGASLVTWFAAITSGRLIAYVMDHALLKAGL
jgi:hypothetical protein